MSNTLTPEEENGNTVASTNNKEDNKVENVKRKQTLFIKTNFRTILVDEVNSVSNIKFIGSSVLANRAVQENNVPDVRTNIIMRSQFDIHLFPNSVSVVLKTFFYASTTFVVVVCTPRTLSIIVKSPTSKTRSIFLCSLVNYNSTRRFYLT